MLRAVEISRDVLWGCLTHALTTEHEEILGLLLGTIACDVAYITRSQVLSRKVKLKDRVEVGYENLAGASELAEQFSIADGSYCRVVGWYHSHPHITVFPSHVDVRTQGQYQQLDAHFIGLIFSVFDRNVNSVCAFQSVETAEGGWQRMEIPIYIQQSPPGCPVDHYSNRRIDSLFSLHMEYLNEDYKSFMGSVSSASPVDVVQAAAYHSSALCSVLHNVSIPLLSSLRSKKASMLAEKNVLMSRVSGSAGEVSAADRAAAGRAPIVAAESSSLLWKNSIDFIKFANSGINVTVELPDKTYYTDCQLRITLATMEACCCADIAETSPARCLRAIDACLKSGLNSPWLCHYGIEISPLIGVCFSDNRGSGMTGWMRLKVLCPDTGEFDSVTVHFNRENDGDDRLESLFRDYFISSFVLLDCTA